jgi:hypothetical protein
MKPALLKTSPSEERGWHKLVYKFITAEQFWMAEWLALLLRIQEGWGLILDPEAWHPYVYSWFSLVQCKSWENTSKSANISSFLILPASPLTIKSQSTLRKIYLIYAREEKSTCVRFIFFVLPSQNNYWLWEVKVISMALSLSLSLSLSIPL